MHSQETKRWVMGGLLAGLILGLGLAGVMAAAVLNGLRQEGLRVTLQTEQIALQVQAEVRTAVRRELPPLLAAASAQLPQRVAAEAARRLASSSVEVGGFRVAVPPTAVEQVQTGIEAALHRGMADALASADVGRLADRAGTQAYALVRHRLASGLQDQQLALDVWPGFSLPITLVAE